MPKTLARHPNVDLVTVTVKVPDHYPPVMAAIAAGKHVYCEWPLGCSTDEALRILKRRKARAFATSSAAGQRAPAIAGARDLVATGYVGRVRAAKLAIVGTSGWGAAIDRAYQADWSNGANLFTITGGHCLDALCHCLGEFRDLDAFVVNQRDRIAIEGTVETVVKTSPDQIAVQGIVGDNTLVSFQLRSGMPRGTAFLFEIHGDEGDLALSAPSRASMQRQELRLQGGRGKDKDLADLAIPDTYRFVPETLDRAPRPITSAKSTRSLPRACAVGCLRAPASMRRSPAIACSIESSKLQRRD